MTVYYWIGVVRKYQAAMEGYRVPSWGAHDTGSVIQSGCSILLWSNDEQVFFYLYIYF